jgi:ATP phosphoribosyltransferase regulatory subunit
MSKQLPLPVPPGSQDLLAPEVRRRRHAQRLWFGLAESRGYAEVIPPTFEYEEVFTRGAGPELARRLIRFVDRDGRVVALRADFTSSIARVAATRLQHAPSPIRLCYAGKVYRQEPEGDGRRRELFQLGAELIGAPGPEGDVEILRLAIDTLRRLGVAEFQINVGDTRFLGPLLGAVPAGARERVRAAVDRRDRRALEHAAAELGDRDAGAGILRALPTLIGRGAVLERAAQLAEAPESAEAVAGLRALDASLTDDERAHVVYDLAEVRGLGYYTGMQFEAFAAGHGRAIGYGGRYDHLLALYGADRPAVGFALEMDALADGQGDAR